MAMPTFYAGRRVTGAQLEQMARQIDSLTAPAWTSYTPTLTSSGTAPSLGNGVAQGRYRRAANADLVVVQGVITLGSTSTIGTGTLFTSLPLAASTTALNQVMTGSARVFDSGVGEFGVICVLDTATRLHFSGQAGLVTHTWQTWNTSDHIAWSIQYEPA